MRERRVMLGLTQQQLAERAGISIDRVSRLEVGTVRILARRLHRVAEVLKVDVAYFLEGR